MVHKLQLAIPEPYQHAIPFHNCFDFMASKHLFHFTIVVDNKSTDCLATKEAVNSPEGYNRPNIELSGEQLLRICDHVYENKGPC